MNHSVGVVGLGIMGSAMAGSLMKAGYRVVGFDVLETRRRAHRRAGGVPVRRCRDVGLEAGVIITSLPSADALLTTAAELAETAPPHIVIETSTLPIEAKEAARKQLASTGTTLLDCPLSGTGSQARVRDLVVYASGDRRAYKRVSPVLDAIARAHHHVGAFGNGSKTKFVANLLVAIHNVAAAEALVLAKRAGLDQKTTLRVVADGAGSSRMLEVRGPLIVRGDFPAQMKLDLFMKDLHLIQDAAADVGARLPLTDVAERLYARAQAAGHGGEDLAVVATALEPGLMPT